MNSDALSLGRPAITRAVSVQVQSVLYNLGIESVARTLQFLDSAAHAAKTAGLVTEVTVVHGDCSPSMTLTDDDLDDLRGRFTNLSAIDYTYFSANLGSAAGHNRLFNPAAADMMLILNPDVLLAPNALCELLHPFRHAGVGIVEARQIPVEHPKTFDPRTGETSWASGACAMLPTPLFQHAGRFDDATFFLYCDDVDLSWRVRLLGFSIIYQPSAVAFHDKRLLDNGRWDASATERYYSAESALSLPYKYSRSDITESYLNYFESSADEHLLAAAAAFRERSRTGRLPAQIDADHMVAEFIDGTYAKHRFVMG